MSKSFKSISFFLLFLIIAVLVVQVFVGRQEKTEDKVASDFYDNEDTVKQFDVIVIGGEPEGIAAALSAARNGAKTLLIEKRASLGGLFTYGEMNVIDFPHGIDNKVLNNGIFKEWHSLVGKSESFEIKAAKSAFSEMVETQENLSVLLSTQIKDINLLNQTEIQSIKVLKNQKEYTLQAKYYIDATQDADVAYLSGVPYFIGAEDVGQTKSQMAVTMMIHLENVDWEKIKEVAIRKTFGPAEVTDKAAWGFAKLREMYKPHDPNMRLRGFNLIRNHEGYYINALQIFGVDGLSEASIQDGLVRGKKETAIILDWLKENFPGFEQAKIASFPAELYVRETRHIRSLYQLPISDLWENKYHWDTIAYGGYPADIQATSVEDPGAVVLNPTQYGIPFRSLVPQKITNLLVVGRSGGYSSLAQGSVRIVPTGMATGEGAGAASGIALNKNIDFHTMASNKEAIAELQQALKAQGAAVDKFSIPYPYEDKWYYPAIRGLLNHRALFTGYTNDLLLDKKATNKSFSNMLMYTYWTKSTSNKKYEDNAKYLDHYFNTEKEQNLTTDEINNILEGLPVKDYHRTYLEEMKKWEGKDEITREAMFIIVGKLFGWI
ncbi:FAD-dependent oxidoreductase [Schinkia sp. CFF1]